MQRGDKLKYMGTSVWAGIRPGAEVTFERYHPTDKRFIMVAEALARYPGSNQKIENFKPLDKSGRMILTGDPVKRKSTPITSGVLDYFPRALAAVAQCSKAGNDQHNPGQPLHWAKDKSMDHADCIARHLIDRKSIDTDGIPHSAKLAWRALALLETELEAAEHAVS